MMKGPFVLNRIRAAISGKSPVDRLRGPGPWPGTRRQPRVAFQASAQYWEDRYEKGGDSGAGSYGRLALFKAEVVNDFVHRHQIRSVVEFGCGDGAQLALASYPTYVGVDVSQRAIEICREKYKSDRTKQFCHLSNATASIVRAELALSLDVVYHLIEDAAYDSYMRQLTAAAERYVCVYSSNCDADSVAPHIKHRRFTSWIERHAPSFVFLATIENPYPYDPAAPDDTSWADFHFFARG